MREAWEREEGGLELDLGEEDLLSMFDEEVDVEVEE
jgi:hypothetical protein